MPYDRRARRSSPLLEQLDDRCLLSGYTPAQITGAYGLNAITFTSPSGSTIQGDGSGQTIALIEEYHDPHIQSDLKTFDSQYHLPAASLTVVNQAGNQTNNSWALEEAMDVEYAHAIAPGARILVVEAAPSSSQTKELQNQLKAVNTARHTQGVTVISMSWGYNERSNEASYDTYFTTPSEHTGITFIASSGDIGSSEYPASSPNVLSVGGTSLFLTSSGSYQSETAWFFSGGSYSPYEPEPSYQRSVQSTGQRATPDVAFDADPNTGVEVYETSPHSGKGSWQVYAGTSLGAPAWAGIIAIVDQGRALAGKGSLDGPTQTLPALYALPASDFHDVNPVTPVGGPSSWLWYLFGSDYDGATANIATGLGSPDGHPLIADLVASTTTSPTTSENGPNGSSRTIAIDPTNSYRRGSKHHHKVRHDHTTH
ncbi:MAG: peptidase S8 and S53 subtilisin kexin sedolisin [Isosphaeraceae bacterium]